VERAFEVLRDSPSPLSFCATIRMTASTPSGAMRGWQRGAPLKGDERRSSKFTPSHCIKLRLGRSRVVAFLFRLRLETCPTKMDSQPLPPAVASLIESRKQAWSESLSQQFGKRFASTACDSRMSGLHERCTTSLLANLTWRAGAPHTLSQLGDISSLRASAWASREGRKLIIRPRVTRDGKEDQLWESDHREVIEPSLDLLVTGLVRKDGEDHYLSFLPSKNTKTVKEIRAEDLVSVPLVFPPFDIKVSGESQGFTEGQHSATGPSTGIQHSGDRPVPQVDNNAEAKAYAEGMWQSMLGRSPTALASIESAVKSLDLGLQSLAEIHDQPKKHSDLEKMLKVATYKLAVGGRTIFDTTAKLYIPYPA